MILTKFPFHADFSSRKVYIHLKLAINLPSLIFPIKPVLKATYETYFVATASKVKIVGKFCL